MSNNFKTLNNIDESYQRHVIPFLQNDHIYCLFDNNCDNDRVIINGKIDKIVNIPKNINYLLNIDSTFENIVHIPMASNIYIEYSDIKENINVLNICDTKSNNYLIDNPIQFHSVKTQKNIIFQDIIIQTVETIIIVQIYKFKKPIENILYGAFIIYQNDFNNMNCNNVICYSKHNDIKLNNIINDDKILYANN